MATFGTPVSVELILQTEFRQPSKDEEAETPNPWPLNPKILNRLNPKSQTPEPSIKPFSPPSVDLMSLSPEVELGCRTRLGNFEPWVISRRLVKGEIYQGFKRG